MDDKMKKNMFASISSTVLELRTLKELTFIFLFNIRKYILSLTEVFKWKYYVTVKRYKWPVVEVKIKVNVMVSLTSSSKHNRSSSC